MSKQVFQPISSTHRIEENGKVLGSLFMEIVEEGDKLVGWDLTYKGEKRRYMIGDQVLGKPLEDVFMAEVDFVEEVEARLNEGRDAVAFLKSLSKKGGAIVSTNSLQPSQIAHAEARDTFFVTEDLLGFVRVDHLQEPA